MTKEQLLALRDRLYLHDEIPDDALDGDDPPYFRPAEDSVEYQYMMERRQALDGSLPKRIDAAHARRSSCPTDEPFAELRGGSGDAGGVDHDGLHPPAAQPGPRRARSAPRVVPIIPDEARTFGMDALFRELKIYAVAGPEVRAGRPRPAALLRRVDRRPDPRGGHHRGRLDGQLHRRRHRLRHPRRADGAVLHLLFDVRLPAGRRPHLAGGRRPRPRLPARRHRRAHHAARRGPPAPGRPQPRAGLDRAGRARPTTRRSPTRWRTIVQAGHATGCTAADRPSRPDVFYYLTLYNENYAMPAMPDTPASTERDRRGPVPVAPTRPTGRQAGDASLFSGTAQQRRPRGRRRARRALRRRRRAVVGHVVQGAARGGAGGRALEPPAPEPGAARAARRPSCSATADGPIVAVTDFMKIVPEQIARFLPGRTFMPLGTDGIGRSRHPRGAAPLLRDRRRPRRRRRARRAWPREGDGRADVGRRRHRPLRHRPRRCPTPPDASRSGRLPRRRSSHHRRSRGRRAAHHATARRC